jgi:hypothetical protein
MSHTSQKALSTALVAALLVCCSGAPAEQQPPASPSRIAASPGQTLPAGSISVANSVELTTALALRSARDIYLLPGVYESSGPFVDAFGHRVRATQPGRAVLHAGLVVGGDAAARNAVVEGLAFDVSTRAKTLEGAAVLVWGEATGARIRDLTIEGNGVLGSGILARQPDGLIVEKVRARGFTDYGVFVDANDQDRVVTRPPVIEDLTVTEVGRMPARSSNGTAEACLWLGNSASVRRVVLRTCAWMGVWTGTATRSTTIDDAVIDDTPVGVYIEHFTAASLFEHLHIGPRVQTGVVCEWADPQWGGKPACVDNVIQDSTIESCAIGVNMGNGTTRTTVRRVTFIGQRVAAAIDVAGVANAFTDNDYSGLAKNAHLIATGAQAAALLNLEIATSCS